MVVESIIFHAEQNLLDGRRLLFTAGEAIKEEWEE